VLEATQTAGAFIHYAGAEQGWLNRVNLYGVSAKPDLPENALSALEGPLRKTLGSFALNKVHAICVAPSWYAPNFASSTGLPTPSTTKKEDKARIVGLLKAVEKSRSYNVIAQQEFWDVGLFTLKKELHELSRLKTKARAYYCFPGPTSVALGAFLSHFMKATPTFAEDPKFTSLVGLSFYGGGATRLVRSIRAVPEGSAAAAYYGDDALIILRTMSGRRFAFLPDVRAMDMNTPEGFKDLWLWHISQHWVGESDDTLYSSGMALYQALLKDARYLLPYGKIAKLQNFSTTGLTANTQYQTFVNSLVWNWKLKPLAEHMLRNGGGDQDKAGDLALVKEIAAQMYIVMEEIGLGWKPEATPFRISDTSLKGLLGHNLCYDKTSFQTTAHVPLGRLMASLVNPGVVAKKEATSVVQAYGRSIALLIAGGYHYRTFVHLVDKLREAVLDILPHLSMEHVNKLLSLEHGTDLGIGGDEVWFAPALYLNENGEVCVRSPPTALQLQALRLEETEDTLGERILKLGRHCKLAKSSVPRAGQKSKKGKPKSGSRAKESQRAGGKRSLPPFVAPGSKSGNSNATTNAAKAASRKKELKAAKRKRKREAAAASRAEAAAAEVGDATAAWAKEPGANDEG
jgi:hypothetical protein